MGARASCRGPLVGPILARRLHGALAVCKVVDFWFESEQDLEMALKTPEGQAAIADLPTFATGGVTVVRSVVQEELAQVTPGA